MFYFERISENYYQWKNILIKTITGIWRHFFSKIYLVILFFLVFINFFCAYHLIDKFDQNSGKLASLHYNIDYGVDLIGDAKNIFVLPSLGAIISIINLFVISLFFNKKNGIFFMHILYITALLVNVFLLLGIFSLYLINFR
jgi:hypothetical protein